MGARIAIATAFAACMLCGCVTYDMADGRPGPSRETHHDTGQDRDYAKNACDGVVNSDAYIECRRRADDARRQTPLPRRDPERLPGAPA